ncbi:MAG: MFS transporter [Dehalococcoidia bacterium]|nr:MFS transporter [Dehalococcoidia bacterium]
MSIFAQLARARPKLYYGWWMTVFAVITALPNTILFTGFSGFLEPLQVSFAASAAAISVAFVFLRAEAGIGTPIAGFLVDAYGPKPVMLGGGIVLGLGAVIVALSQSLFVFYIGFFILAFGVSVSGPIVANIAVARWFDRYRGKAFAVISMGTPVWSLSIPLVVLAIDTFGWRATMWGLGIISVAIIVPFSFLYRRSPEEYGLKPDGVSDAAPKPQHAVRGPEVSLSLRDVLRHPAFWLLMVSYGSFSFVHTGLFSQLIPILEKSSGVSRSTAAAVSALIALVSLPGRLVLGTLADTIKPGYILALTFALMLVGVLALALVPGDLGMIAMVVFYGIGFGGCVPVRHVVQGYLFGTQNFGKVQGMLRIADTVVGIPAPIATALIYDATHSYVLALLMFVVVFALTIPAALSPRMSSVAQKV